MDIKQSMHDGTLTSLCQPQMIRPTSCPSHPPLTTQHPPPSTSHPHLNCEAQAQGRFQEIGFPLLPIRRLEENCFSYGEEEEEMADGETETEDERSQEDFGSSWSSRNGWRRRRKRRNRKSRREREEETRLSKRRKRNVRTSNLRPFQGEASPEKEQQPPFRRSLVSPSVPDEELLSLLRYLDDGADKNNSLTAMSAASPPASSCSGDSGYDCCPPSVGSSHQGAVSSEQVPLEQPTATGGEDLWDQVLRTIGASEMQDLCTSFQGMEEEDLGQGIMDEQQQQQQNNHHHLSQG